MRYITEIGLTSRFFQGKGAYQILYHKNNGTLPSNYLPFLSCFHTDTRFDSIKPTAVERARQKAIQDEGVAKLFLRQL